MEDANFDAHVYYNAKGDDYNNDQGLDPDSARLLSRLISLRGIRRMREMQRLEAEAAKLPDWVPEWERMPTIAKEYQATVNAGGGKVDEVSNLDVLASDDDDDPTLSFTERRDPGRKGSHLDGPG